MIQLFNYGILLEMNAIFVSYLMFFSARQASGKNKWN